MQVPFLIPFSAALWRSDLTADCVYGMIGLIAEAAAAQRAGIEINTDRSGQHVSSTVYRRKLDDSHPGN